MAEKRRTGLGKGLAALIPGAPGGARPVDVFFPPEQAAQTDAPNRATASDSPGSAVEPSMITSSVSAPASSETTRASAVPTEDDDRIVPGSEPELAGTRGPEADDGTGEHLESVGSRASAPTFATPDPAPGPDSPADEHTLAPVPGVTFAELPLDAIVANAHQPRQVFDDDDLEELASSIREVGVLQPVVVRPIEPAPTDPAAPRFELVMGERRWRASRLAGNSAVPALIRSTTEDDLLRDALLENLHRVQLNPLEEAAAYQQLLDDFSCTHEELASRLARSRPQISNTLRLLRLPPLVQRRVAAGVLSAGHARALLGLTDGAATERLAQRIVAEGLSVRATEEIVAIGDDEPLRPELRRRPRPGEHSAALSDLSARLSDRWDTRVKIALGQRKGRISIEFASVQDLNRIVDAIAPDDPGVLR